MMLKHATRTLMTSAIVALVLGFSALSYASTCCGSLNQYFQSLSTADLGLVEQAAQKILDAPSVGTIHAWENDENGNSGTVQFILRYRSENAECRKLWYVFDVPQSPEEIWEVNSCKVGQKWTLNQSPKLL